MSDCGVLIAGAGLAGLSTAYHLGAGRSRLIEAADELGGLCRSVRERGYTFDHTGHLLHLRRPEMRELVLRLVGDQGFLPIDRHSGVYSHGAYTEYPFQVNTFGLPKPVVRDCVMGFAETLGRRVDLPADPSFHEWALATFGRGICDHFMIPYNAKLLRTDLGTVTADWVSWSIPKPTWADVVRGAQGLNRKAFGYNPQFLYPAAGGIDHLPRAFLPHIEAPEVGVRLERIVLARNEARLSTGERVRYRLLVSTLPLPRLLRAIEDLPAEMARVAGELRWVSVRNLNLGFDSPSLRPYHWVYFPEAEFPFYRVGVYSNLCPASVPQGHSSYYVEVSYRSGEKPAERTLAERSAEALRRAGMVPERARLDHVRAIDIPFAYVIHDRERSRRLPEVLAFLESRGVLSVGRYGAWEYSAMEDALWHGRLAAEKARAAGAT